MDKAMWQPTPQTAAKSHMEHFIHFINEQYQQSINNYPILYQWSLKNPEAFWEAVWKFCNVVASKQPQKIMQKAKSMQKTKWFEGARLNFAENLLKRRDQHPALIFSSENGEHRIISYKTLYETVKSLAIYLRKLKVQPGDRVVGFMSNIPETIIAMLATTSIGAIWSACSADFGLEGLIDRFEQIKPKILFAVGGHSYKGKTFNHLNTIQKLQEQLPTLEQTILIPYLQKKPDISQLKNTHLYATCLLENYNDFYFEQLPFDHPIYILYSSGTTGKPKCMVHGAGGTLLQHLKELMLHTNCHPENRIFFYATRY